ncbi:MAG: ATP-binding protein [Candidatus Omnitrophica bacterium]|nr:ATP-binding protein [Candidatus Omnitrophota bacterium]
MSPSTHPRTIYKTLWDDLSSQKPLVMLAGPRQSGKTVFAGRIAAKDFADVVYFNWDAEKDKRRLIGDRAFFSSEPRQNASKKPLVILDEIHKYRDWKNYLKGVYDQFAEEYQFLVTGSGRLEYSRKAGDSLAGRFFRFHIFPFTLAEFASRRKLLKDFLKDPLEDQTEASVGQTRTIFEQLWEFSGFPEPFTRGKKSFWSLWSPAYGQQIVRDDLRTMADLRNLDLVETLFALIPGRVASPLSINNLAGDLGVSFDTVKSWMLLFDAFYLTFRLSPWTERISRSILKEKKVYLFNYPVVEDEAARFENLVAVEFLRAVQSWNDSGATGFDLSYIRNKEKQEVDFLITRSNKPLLLAEIKLADETPAANLRMFQDRLNVPAIQLVKKEGVKKIYKNGKNSILVITAHRWLSSLP